MLVVILKLLFASYMYQAPWSFCLFVIAVFCDHLLLIIVLLVNWLFQRLVVLLQKYVHSLSMWVVVAVVLISILSFSQDRA